MRTIDKAIEGAKTLGKIGLLVGVGLGVVVGLGAGTLSGGIVVGLLAAFKLGASGLLWGAVFGGIYGALSSDKAPANGMDSRSAALSQQPALSPELAQEQALGQQRNWQDSVTQSRAPNPYQQTMR